MENQVLVKSELESNRELLVFYVDENGSHEGGVVTSIENIEETSLEQLQQGNYILGDVDTINEIQTESTANEDIALGKWLDDETKKLLIFYIDNKDNFLNGTTKKQHLWTVACKTMLLGKNPSSCEYRLEYLKRNYTLLRIDQMKGNTLVWPYYELCHKAFHDDANVNIVINESMTKSELPAMYISVQSERYDDVGILVKKTNTKTSAPDEKVELMLNLYLQYKKKRPKDYWQKHLWESIALEIGEDGDYWHKRFLNFKQHYIRMLDKRRVSGNDSINWPYMKLFDQIYEDDKDFQRKYGDLCKPPVKIISDVVTKPSVVEWDETEKTVLVKYYFDCFDEFQDPTIPNNFLWSEVGRLLDKKPEDCKQKYEAMKTAHLSQYIEGEYDLYNRIPIAILFDNIISKETELMVVKGSSKDQLELWKTEEIDEMVKYFYDHMELFKDSICHSVCWAAVSKILKRNIHACKLQWQDLTALYKSILDDKKENPDMEIDWRYIELFDRIFDYGMDTKLLEGYEKKPENPGKSESGKIGVKKLNIKLDDDLTENGTDDEEYDERGFIKRSRGSGDMKHFKILEYYHKNKDKFSTTQRKKQALWEVLAEQIGISAEQCAHRFRNLKQVYTAYVQREINKPDMPILWPYYALCKKVFGYRAIKNKLKHGKLDSDSSEDWTAREIKQVINHFAKNFTQINEDTDNRALWSDLAKEIDKSETACRDKFLELRKSYRKIKTMKSRNPDCKVNWKYFKLFDEIYSSSQSEAMDVDSNNEKVYVPLELPVVKTDTDNIQDDDEFQCIIVIPEGEDLTDLSNAQIVIKQVSDDAAPAEPTKKHRRWPIKLKRFLLRTYLNYITANRGKVINTKEMWKEIAKKFPESTIRSCKMMYFKMKSIHKRKVSANDTAYMNSKYYSLFQKIFAEKPKLVRPPLTIEDIDLHEMKTYSDIELPLWKVQEALKYYLNHIEEFVSPKYVKKYVWRDLATAVGLPISKIFKKINYLKQSYNGETTNEEDKSEDFGGVLKEIFEKEFILKIALANEPKLTTAEQEPTETSWTDDETEQLLKWYLENLDKFKNPKFVTSYLWMEASSLLNKSPLACSEKMSEIRTQYSTMVKEKSDALESWRFHELCQKIYGTGKKTTPVSSEEMKM